VTTEPDTDHVDDKPKPDGTQRGRARRSGQVTSRTPSLRVTSLGCSCRHPVGNLPLSDQVDRHALGAVP